MAGTAEMTTDERPYQSPNPHRLYRNPEEGVLFGVCAGLADYFGGKAWQSELRDTRQLLDAL